MDLLALIPSPVDRRAAGKKKGALSRAFPSSTDSGSADSRSVERCVPAAVRRLGSGRALDGRVDRAGIRERVVGRNVDEVHVLIVRIAEHVLEVAGVIRVDVLQ